MKRWMVPGTPVGSRRSPDGHHVDDPSRRRLLGLVVVAALVIVTAAASSGEHVSGNRVLVIGDSLLHGSQDDVRLALAAAGWQAVIDGRPGSSIEGWVPVVGAEAALARPDVAVVELGTNNCHFPCNDPGPAIDAVMTSLVHAGVGAVLWLNVQERPFYPKHSRYDNLAIEEAAVRWPQMEVVDLRGLFDSHPEWHADGLHFNAVGQQQMAALIVRSLHRWGPSAPRH